MKSFKSLQEVVPKGAQTCGNVSAVGVSVKRFGRIDLSTSDKLKFKKSAQRGGGKFTFIKTDKKSVSDLDNLYDLHIRLYVIFNAITFFDMDDAFNIIPYKAVKLLESKLQNIFVAQT